MVSLAEGGKYKFVCSGCGRENIIKDRNNARRSERRGTCKKCMWEPRPELDKHITARKDGKYEVACPQCKTLQVFSRRSVARSMVFSKRPCRACYLALSRVATGTHRGFQSRDFLSIVRSAATRQIPWGITVDDIADMWDVQGGLCALSGAQLCKVPKTWSIDRINSAGGYTPGNIQIVHKDINMMKQSYSSEYFIAMCCHVAQHAGDSLHNSPKAA